MRTSIMASIIIICFVLTTMDILTINSAASVKVEEQTQLNNIVDASLKSLELDKRYNTENYESIVNDLLQLIILQSSSDGSINIKILELNTEEGLLDVEVSKTYRWFGIKKQIVSRRTVILEEYDTPSVSQVVVKFVYNDQDTEGNDVLVVHKEEVTFDGAVIKRPKNPKKQGYTFKGWGLTEGTTTPVSDEDWQNFIIDNAMGSEIYFYAIFVPNPAK